MILRFIKHLYRFFPLQLLILHVKKHQIILLFWLILFLSITDHFGNEFGINYLFLDPEYLGEVNYLSFAILGFAFGGFFMVWNITTYILNGNRFPFLATFKRPFAVYCLNNAILPLALIITYGILMYKFQVKSEFLKGQYVVIEIVGFLSGIIANVVFSAVYFQTTNKNIFSMFGKNRSEFNRLESRVKIRQSKIWEEKNKEPKEFEVTHYLSTSLKIRPTRTVEHYENSMIKKVFDQNHSNALTIQIVSLLILLGFSYVVNNPFFQIPAGASSLLVATILIALSGILEFWFLRWRVFIIILTLIGLNFLLQKEIINQNSNAYGIDYNKDPVAYSIDVLDTIASPENIQLDIESTIKALEAWKKKTGERKPKMILTNFSGGGLSSATFAYSLFQKIDSLFNGKIMEHTALMCGASGGIMSAAYLREIYLQSQLNDTIDPYKEEYRLNIAKDLLNPIVFTFAVNDLFFQFHHVKLDEKKYRLDRGYSFENQFHINTKHLVNKSIGDYREYEESGIIPKLIISPTIINDERKLYISSTPVRYLMRPINKSYQPDYNDIDGVDFLSLFKNYDADELRLSSAIRMNASYPYILPNIGLPTSPEIKVSDAGFRDNYGIETSIRFIQIFKDWIKKNTSGVILIQTRIVEKDIEVEKYERNTLVNLFFDPVSNLYTNMFKVQDYEQNYLLSFGEEWLDGNLDYIIFEYRPEKKEDEASLNLHLTSKEKKDIFKTLNQPHIEYSIQRLKKHF